MSIKGFSEFAYSFYKILVNRAIPRPVGFSFCLLFVSSFAAFASAKTLPKEIGTSVPLLLVSFSFFALRRTYPKLKGC